MELFSGYVKGAVLLSEGCCRFRSEGWQQGKFLRGADASLFIFSRPPAVPLVIFPTLARLRSVGGLSFTWQYISISHYRYLFAISHLLPDSSQQYSVFSSIEFPVP